MASQDHSHGHLPGHSHGQLRRPAFDLPIAALTAGWWMRLAALLPLIALLWAAIAWALAVE